MAPRRIRAIENGFERFNSYILRFFKHVMIPDYEDNGISGDLAHNLNIIKNSKLVYFGILSDFKKLDVEQDIDFLFSISGPEPQRSVMEKLIMKNINEIEGKIIVSLGRKTQGKIDELRGGMNDNIELFDFLPREERELVMNRSKFIVSRSGYSTLMDIYALGKKAMFIPTPQQTEQEYLARHHEERGNFYYTKQSELDLIKDLQKAKGYKGPDRNYDIKKTTERFLEVVYG
jgi:predicted glycosyltransferase